MQSVEENWNRARAQSHCTVYHL